MKDQKFNLIKALRQKVKTENITKNIASKSKISRFFPFALNNNNTSAATNKTKARLASKAIRE